MKYVAHKRWAKWVIGLLASFMIAVWMMMVPHPAAPTAPLDRDHLKAWLDSIVSSQAATAISISVIQNGDVALEMASGTANPFRTQQATPQTRYHVWSVTKLATALTILTLAEDRELDLDLPVTEILPWLDLDEAAENRITTRDLLRHRSGLLDTVPAVFGWLQYDENLPNQTEFLRQKMPAYRDLGFQPGDDRSYSNLGYMLLGAIIEAVSGQVYEEVVFERVLEPAGMASSSFVFGAPQSEDEALGSHPLVHFFTPFLPYFVDLDDLIRERDGRIWWLNRVYIKATPPTGLIASARDAARLGSVTMAKGPVLQSDEMVRLMIAPDQEDFSLGWFERDAAAQWLQHRGRGPGFAAVVRVYPAQGLSIAVLASGTDAPVADIADVVAQSLGDEE
ncbi:beta-lactamase family protein [Aliiroseovarius sp. S1339]|uniref:serine hydrolase domain-containing protein n=1 Tax=Aliiroseovarius sp. S1339 TaxID=2936990 RepID=UPI0020BEF5EC|nr:serine hydrolase domain-containing protein [Aliiroseovarius sp. S1339]MCK8464167.1 beta-lactamase family protein [Aliiroseovarius sp. S1339]